MCKESCQNTNKKGGQRDVEHRLNKNINKQKTKNRYKKTQKKLKRPHSTTKATI